eukprot:scaffold15861_cov35-Tisochrysis_lutea.AAC.1
MSPSYCCAVSVSAERRRRLLRRERAARQPSGGLGAMVRAAQAVAAKPLELGAKLLCRWRGNDLKPCEIIERKLKTLPDGTPDPAAEWEYCECGCTCSLTRASRCLGVQ